MNFCSLSHRPVGHKAPVFATDSKNFLFERPGGSDVVLIANVQAFPVASVRLGKTIWNSDLSLLFSIFDLKHKI